MPPLASSLPPSRHHWFPHHSPSPIRQNHYATSTNFRYCFASPPSIRTQHGERIRFANSGAEMCSLPSFLDEAAVGVDVNVNDAHDQELALSPKRFLGLQERNVCTKMFRQFAPAMDRRIFVSLITSHLASVSWIGLMTATPALAVSEKNKGKRSPFDDKRLLEQNKRMQQLNNAPAGFPTFIREGFDVKVVTTENYVKCDSGLVYLDIEEGQGDFPKDGQQITFHYIGYNESGRRVDSTYQQGRPAKTRVGINAMVPGFEEGIRTMKPGGKRRIVVPPELGPPVGPSTFFSAKQFEVFDVELLGAKDCTRRTLGFYSDVVCD